MTALRVRPEAEVDAFEAAIWYEAFRHIERHPRRVPVLADGIRRAMLRRFPFGVFFVIGDHEVTVIAILHLHHDPSSWEERG